jgi:predicted dehydrogenase
MPKQVRIGLIGCGGITHHHARLLQDIPEAKVVALNDTDEGSIQRLKERFPHLKRVKAFNDCRAMIDAVPMDAVEIGTPHTLHYPHIKFALEHGLHVLCEKPLVCKVSHAQAVLRLAKKQGKVLMVSYQRHYQPEFRYMRQVIQSGELGDVTFISALQDQGWYPWVKGKWRADPKLSGGGQLNDSGSHLVDILLYVTGLQVQEVFAYQENFDTEVDINSALSLKFTNGAQGNISVVGFAPRWWEDITIWGTKGALYMRNGKLTHMPMGKDPFTPAPEDMPKSTNTDRNFIDAILGRDEPQSPAECGLRVIELTECAWESARTRMPCRLNGSSRK